MQALIPSFPAVQGDRIGRLLIYLAEKSGTLRPDDPRRWFDVVQWLMWQMGGPGYDKEAHRLLRVAEKRLAKSEYLAGDFYSIGDIGIWPHCGSVERFGASLDKYPNITRWFDLVGNAGGKSRRCDQVRIEAAGA